MTNDSLITDICTAFPNVWFLSKWSSHMLTFSPKKYFYFPFVLMLDYLHITNNNIGLTFWEKSWILLNWMYLVCSFLLLLQCHTVSLAWTLQVCAKLDDSRYPVHFWYYIIIFFFLHVKMWNCEFQIIFVVRSPLNIVCNSHVQVYGSNLTCDIFNVKIGNHMWRRVKKKKWNWDMRKQISPDFIKILCLPYINLPL